jgi:hypothetical protein
MHVFNPPAHKGEIRDSVLCGFSPLFRVDRLLAHGYTFRTSHAASDSLKPFDARQMRCFP